jgi:formylglycine-generating enzyme
VAANVCDGLKGRCTSGPHLVYAACIAILLRLELGIAWLTLDFPGAKMGVGWTNHASNMKSKLSFVLVAMALAASLHPVEADVAPRLMVVSTNHHALLYWPSTETNYVLQYCTNLAKPKWAYAMDAGRAVYGTNTALTVTNLTQPRFFRLMHIFGMPATTPPSNMLPISAGTFTMGDTLDGITNAHPVSVTVSAFYMDTNLVTYSQWQQVYCCGIILGGSFDNVGSGQGTNYPATSMHWFDCVTWCNARSIVEGLTPAYYWDADFTQIYSGGIGVAYVDWEADGYRLPTEAEWERAARGGHEQQRFPTGNSISESDANYVGYASGVLPYDLGPAGWNPVGQGGTTPVGTFPANSYGLRDMAGNVAEWCWDTYGVPYAGGTDPHGPTTGNARVLRGGAYSSHADSLRCAHRGALYPVFSDVAIGFRCVRGH